MLRVLGSTKRLCDGSTRRDFLTASTLGLLAGLTGKANDSPPAAPRFGKAKACILLFLYGSPSQLETFDPKPDAPAEVRGELGTIPSILPGVRVGELLPHTSRILDRVTVLRSLTHPYPIHGVAYATTGVPEIDVPMELNPRDARHWPFVGSAVAYLKEGKRPPVPDNIALPFPFSSRRSGEVQRAGPYAAWLGGAYHPHFTDFHGEATASVPKSLNGTKLDVREPYVGVDSACHFSLGRSATDAPELTLDRLDGRRSLLAQFDAGRPALDRTLERHRETAWSLLTSDRLRDALDVRREPAPVRERYGMTLFGQGALAARRLVEAGSRFVTVFWDEFGLAGSGWDTHWEHYPRMRRELCPGFDRGLSGLIADLDDRGMLDDTLVVCLSEHGRTPKLQNVSGGGRDHWSRAYSAVLAGGGVARGRVIGRTDSVAGTVQDRPISPKDVLATMYHLLGIDPRTEMHDRANRPVPLVAGEVLTDALA